MSKPSERKSHNHQDTRNIQKLRISWGFLKSGLCSSEIIDQLIQANLYPLEKWRALKHRQTTESDKIEEILIHINEKVKRDHSVFDKFKEALTKSNYTDVVQRLDGADENQSGAGQNTQDTVLQTTTSNDASAGASGGGEVSGTATFNMTELKSFIKDEFKQQNEMIKENMESLHREYSLKNNADKENIQKLEANIEELRVENDNLNKTIKEKERAMRSTGDKRKYEREIRELHKKLDEKTRELETAKRRIWELREKFSEKKTYKLAAGRRQQSNLGAPRNRFQTVPDLEKNNN